MSKKRPSKAEMRETLNAFLPDDGSVVWGDDFKPVSRQGLEAQTNCTSASFLRDGPALEAEASEDPLTGGTGEGDPPPASKGLLRSSKPDWSTTKVALPNSLSVAPHKLERDQC